MPKFKVKKILIIQAAVELIVEAESADAASDVASKLVPSNICNNHHVAGWKAEVTAKPPRGVQIVSPKCKTSWIDSTDDNSKPKKVSEPLLP
jgi:hypothetical protein